MARLEKVLAGEETWGAWSLDQLGHVALGTGVAGAVIVPLVFAYSWPAWLALIVGTAAGVTVGALRELVTYLLNDKPHADKIHWLDRSVDTAFFLPGGPIAVGIVEGVRWLLT